MEPDKEAKRLRPKLVKATDAVKDQQRLISSLGDKVSGEVRSTEDRKLKDLESEQRLFQESLERFEKLHLQSKRHSR